MKEVVLLGYGIFAGSSLLLALLLLTTHRNSGNRLLAIILLLLTARVGKSILSLAWPEIALLANVVGLAAMAALGPMTLFYVQELFNTARRRSWLHGLPMVISLGAWTWTLINVGYIIITVHLLCYLVYVGVMIVKNAELFGVDNIRWRWTKGLLVGMLIISVSFVVQMIFYDPLVYLANVGVSVVALSVLCMWALRQNKLFTEAPRKNLEVDSETYVALGEKVKKLMLEEAFVNADLNLSMMAKKLDVQPYLLSKAINSCFKMTFPELMLEYRLKKAEQLLISSLGKVYTIEAIAYESGFNTLSVFYQAFRNRNGITPTQFKKRMEEEANLIAKARGIKG